MYCGIGKIPKGKERGTVDQCFNNRQVRYYGEVAIDPDVLNKRKNKKRSPDLQKEQLKLKKLEDDGKILVKEYNNLRIIADDDNSKISDVNRAKKRMKQLLQKRDKLVKKLKLQQDVVNELLRRGKAGSKTSKKK